MFEEEKKAALTVVSTGMKVVAQVTTEVREALAEADVVLYATPAPGMPEWIKQINPRAEALTQYYEPGLERVVTYGRMVDRIVSELQAGNTVCAAYYGHAGVYVTPSHAAVQRAREAGFTARMLPGVSAEDCLFADLGIDPGVAGWQSYDATPFLIFQPNFDRHSGLVLWQLEVLGHVDYQPDRQVSHLALLADHLSEHYGPDHQVVVYEAAPFAGFAPRIERIPVRELADTVGVVTLYVPPVGGRTANPDMLARLGMAASGA
jgi:uncharacterized protein YabN with tetrapyrrole methylase and pyrophosphatase domain